MLQEASEVNGGSPKAHLGVQEVQGVQQRRCERVLLHLAWSHNRSPSIGRVDLLINDQTVPKIMGKMRLADWKEWTTKRPEWAREDMGAAFERYVEQKWRDALNIAAAEPHGWEAGGGKVDRGHAKKPAGEKSEGATKRTSKITGATNIVMS
jgi:hypothetical protein